MASQMDIDHAVPLLVGHPIQNQVVEDPGKVDGAVDPAVLVDGVGDQSLGVLGRTDVTEVVHSVPAGLFDRVDGSSAGSVLSPSP